MDSYVNRRIWNTISDHMDEITDLLPSNKGRMSLTTSLTRALKVDLGCDVVEAKDATDKELTSFHGKEFVTELLRQRGSNVEEIYDEKEAHFNKTSHLEKFGLVYDCPLFCGLDRYVRAVAGSSINSARKLILDTKDHLLAINWYGGRHHCQKNRAAGFCYVNDIVMAINVLRRSYRKVFYLDLDLHHGDGVESAFEHSSSVLTCSIHRYDVGFFPGTGSLKSNTATKVNIPTEKGLSDETLATIMAEIVFPVILKFKPDAFVVQLGCDGLSTDPAKEWNLTIKGMGSIVEDLLRFVEPKPCLFFGGGGYNHTEAAKFWTYITSIISGIDTVRHIDEIPEHKHLEEYEHDGYLFWTPKNTAARSIADRNTSNYLHKVKTAILTNFS